MKLIPTMLAARVHHFTKHAPHRSGLRSALLCLATSTGFPSYNFAGTLDQLPDLTDKAAQAVVTLKGRDNFNSEYLFDVSVKNLSADPLVGESLVIVLDRITDISGDQWTSGTSESNLSRMEILGEIIGQGEVIQVVKEGDPVERQTSGRFSQ